MRALVHVAPRAGADAFAERFDALTEKLRERAGRQGMQLVRLQALEEDPLAFGGLYRETLEARGEGLARDSAVWLFEGLGWELADIAHPDLSTLLLGEELVFVPPQPSPLRFQALLRRNAAFDHAAYLRRYREEHAQIGLRTPGAQGYVQFHVDPEASRVAASSVGLGGWAVDSVAELHLESLETFIGAIAGTEIPREAAEDEAVFVDRARTQALTSRVVDA